MLNRLLLLLIGIALVGSGCDYRKDINSDYHLGCSDEEITMALYITIGDYKTEVVNSTVFAVGYNEDFIIAKQHPRYLWYSDKSRTNYFIIPLTEPVSRSKTHNVIGPLSKDKFDSKNIELGIDKDLPFSIVFENLQ